MTGKDIRFSEEIQKVYDSLTPKQRSFIDHYLINGNNGTQAALSAGYSSNTCSEMAYENLRKPQIRIVLDSVIKDAAVRHGLTHDDLVGYTKFLLEVSVEGLKDGTSTKADVKGAVDLAAKLVGAFAPVKQESNTTNTSTVFVVEDEESLRERIMKYEKET